VASYVYNVSGLTVSGSTTTSGTLLPSGDTVSGSHYVNYTYSYSLTAPSGNIAYSAWSPTSSVVRLYAQDIAEARGVSPLDVKDGLVAYHTLDEIGNIFGDSSGNGYLAVTSGTTLPVIAKYNYGRSLSVYPYGHIHAPTLTTFSGTDYMLSFWFRPTTLLTSGNTSTFRMIVSDAFYGDHFDTSINYKTATTGRGWTLLNSATTCQAGTGTDSSSLRFQGVSNSNWFNTTWNASTLYFSIDKDKDWDVEVGFVYPVLLVNQAVGLIFFNKTSYYNYCSMLLVGQATSGLADIILQTQSYSYTGASSLSAPGGTMRFGMQKRGNYIYFRYLYGDTWIWPIYYMDCSLWSSTMRIGVQSRNSSGTSPQIDFTSFEFTRGVKPDDLGSAESPGRLIVSYNEVDTEALTEERNDSRVWFQTNRKGVALGSASFVWKPTSWYLVQFGFKANGTAASHVVRVNAEDQRCLVVGSGVSDGNILTSGGVKYFDPYSQAASGSFILDDVSHWSRWLTNEESLKLINKVSQVSWHITEGYHSSSVLVGTEGTTISGNIPTYAITPTYTTTIAQYTTGPLEASDLEFKKISYRIQKDMLQWSRRPPSTQLSILRCSSGFMGKNRGCWGCVGASGIGACKCDVYAEAAIVYRAYDYPSVTFLEHTIPRKQTVVQPEVQITTTGVVTTYYQTLYDPTGPRLFSSIPTENESMVHPSFEWYTNNEAVFTIKDYASSIETDSTRVWLKHSKAGRHSYQRMDNFSFYEMDFRECNLAPTSSGIFATSVSGHGWNGINIKNTKSAVINHGYLGILDVDMTDTIPGVHRYYSASGIEPLLADMNNSSGHFTPTISVSGSRALEISTTSGNWNTLVKEAPYVYWIVPSGNTSWEFQTALNTYRYGNPQSQWAGVMLTPLNDQSKYYQLLLTTSGAALFSNQTDESLIIPYRRSTSDTDKSWLNLSRTGDNTTFNFSEDGETWNVLSPFVLQSVVPTFSGSNTLGNYFCFDSYNNATYKAWKAFDGTLIDGNDTWGMNATTGYIGVYLVSPTIVYYYQFQSRNATTMTTRYFTNKPWYLQGSNDYNTWTNLDYNAGLGTSDYGNLAWMPGSGIHYYKVSDPGWYKYYRVYFTGMSSWTMIGNIRLWGSAETSVSGISGDIAVGPIVRSDRDLPKYSTPLSLVPTMTSNTVPSGYIISSNVSNSTAYTVFNGNLTTANWTGAFTSPTYLTVQLPSAQIVDRYRLRTWLSTTNPNTWQLRGSNDGSTWDVLHGLANWGASLAQTWTHHLYIPNPRAYKFYQLYVTTAMGSTIGLSQIELLGYPTVTMETLYTPAETTALFDYVKFIASGQPNGIESNDAWELIVDGSGALNSDENSGYSSFTEVGDSTYQIKWEPKEAFEKGEFVYVRVESSDEPSFKPSYLVTSDTQLFIEGQGIAGQHVDEYLTSVSGTYITLDSSNYEYPTYRYYTTSGNTQVMFTTNYVYTKSSALEFQYNGVVRASGIPSLGTMWTYQAWVYPYVPYGNLFSILPVTSTGNSLICSLSGNYISYRGNGSYLGQTLLPTTAVSGWRHIGIMQDELWLHTFLNGSPCVSLYTNGSGFSNSSNIISLGGDGFYGCMEMMKLDHQGLWDKTGLTSTDYDGVYSFRIASWEDITVDINPVIDVAAPVVLPRGPYPSTSGICPASGIIFDILDDFSGVKWTETNIQIGNYTVFSGGNNMTEYFSDRGELSWEEMGEKGGEWESIHLTESGVVYIDGINRSLFPPGTVYSDSGAWGRRFTYYVPDASEISYFGTQLPISISGTDSIGYGSQLDSITPNSFSYSYYFDFIPNDNILFGNVFLEQGQSVRISELKAKDMHFWVDLYDANYPITDIAEEDCGITWSDGISNFTCSGIWFTTWTGTGDGSILGMRYHRMSWKPENDWDWEGNRAVQLAVESHNDNSVCSVYNVNDYIIYYGWQLSWFHQAVPNEFRPFEFNKKFPIFMSIKTHDFAPSRLNKSYMLWSSPGYKCDLNVSLIAMPQAIEDLKVGILAQSAYLQYSEDVGVEITCNDMDGNVLTYTWIFTTEDKPE